MAGVDVPRSRDPLGAELDAFMFHPTTGSERATGPISDERVALAGSWWIHVGVPLVVVALNFAMLMYWRSITGRWLDPWLPWSWRDVTIHLFRGWTLAYVVLAALWLALGGGRAWVRWTVVPTVAAVGILLAMGGLRDTFWGRGIFWSYYLPQWGYLCLLVAIPIAGLHLLLHPLRVLLGWRLEFAAPSRPPPTPARFQFRLRDLIAVTVGVAVALAVIRGSFTILLGAGDLDLIGPPVYLLLSFGHISIPALASAWLILGHKKRWIGGFVLAFALALAPVLVQTSWYTYLSTAPSELWRGHWMNLAAVLCVGANLLALRLCGLRLVIITTRPAKTA